MATIKELQEQNRLLTEKAEREKQIFELDKRRKKSLEKSNDLVKQILDNEDKITNIKKSFDKVTKSELSLEKKLLSNAKQSNVQVAKKLGFVNDKIRQDIISQRLAVKELEQNEDTVGIRKVLNALAEKDQQVRENVADGINEKISKEEILAGLTQDQIDLAKKQGIDAEDIAGKIAEQSANSVKFGKGINIAGKGLSSIKGFLPGIAGVFAFLVSQVIEFGQNIQANRRELGLSVVEAANLSAQSQILGIRAKEFGLGTDAVRTIQADILSNLGGQAKLTNQLVNDFQVIT